MIKHALFFFFFFADRLIAHIPAGDSFSGSAAGSSNSKAKRLADLFRPPFDIMFHGNFEQVCINTKVE